ncbi:MAG TPA: hypothetical protein ENN07_04695 [candidate division Zixibacteria bacterium]|nr:hypothetical protein [candidate division Zixibacteria bacterium]
MDKMNIDYVIDSIIDDFGELKDGRDRLLKSSTRGFRHMRDIPAGEYPIAMTGLVSCELGSQEDLGEALTIFLARGRDARKVLQELKLSATQKLREGRIDASIHNIEIGDLFPGHTESAETETLPEGAYFASWLGINRPVEGFYIAFDISLETD